MDHLLEKFHFTFVMPWLVNIPPLWFHRQQSLLWRHFPVSLLSTSYLHSLKLCSNWILSALSPLILSPTETHYILCRRLLRSSFWCHYKDVTCHQYLYLKFCISNRTIGPTHCLAFPRLGNNIGVSSEDRDRNGWGFFGRFNKNIGGCRNNLRRKGSQEQW